MIFGDEINILLKEFYENNKQIILGVIGTTLSAHMIEAIFVPRKMASVFSNITDSEKFKNNSIQLVTLWSIMQFSFCISEKLNSKIEPAMTKYITDKIIDSSFLKYDNLHSKIDTALLMSRVHLVKGNIEILTHRLFSIMIPRLSGLIFVIGNFIKINPTIGLYTLGVSIFQFYMMTRNIDECMVMAYEEIQNRDDVMEKLCDKIDNIHTISSIQDGLNKEMTKLKKNTEKVMNNRNETTNCVFKKQANGYITNTLAMISILYVMYLEFNKKK